jgi:hypothetical protein
LLIPVASASPPIVRPLRPSTVASFAEADRIASRVLLPRHGPEPDAVMRVHERAGHPTDEVYEVPIEV